jgi:lincosamide nucleotidyltransferase A/C/D/E
MPMPAASAATILEILESHGLRYWVDGGWGVDALVGEQTRAHDDLDLVVPWEEVHALQQALQQEGFAMYEDEMPRGFVLGNPAPSSMYPEEVPRTSFEWQRALRVDVHPVKFERDNSGIQAQPNNGSWRYPPEAFEGRGILGGKSVCCISAEVQILCHDGYELDEEDFADMKLLQDRLGVALPKRLERGG